jgi:hypothetical protein
LGLQRRRRAAACGGVRRAAVWFRRGFIGAG